MKTLYLDLVSGLSGDMFLGALLDLGVELRQVTEALADLPLVGYHVHASRQSKASIVGVRFEVHVEGIPEASPVPGRGGQAPPPHLEAKVAHEHGPGAPGHAHTHHDHPHPHAHDHEHPAATAEHAPGGHGHTHAQPSRDFGQITAMLEASHCSPWVKTKALAVFRRIAVAEGKIHGCPPERVHFHEVGAVDSIVDIVGACVALEALGQPRLWASRVVEGTGWVDCAHGRFPIPAPATLEILGARGIVVAQCEEPHELITPTGAALLAEFAESFGPLPGLRVERIGYGLGRREHRTRPNVVRAILGEAEAPVAAAAHDWETDTVAVLETNLDDINPEILGQFVEQCLAAGALDAFHTPVVMKKGRPGVVLTVLCPQATADRFTELMLRETSAFGVRRTLAERRKLRREFRQVQTPQGPVRVKLGRLDGRIVQAAPEFESCRAVAASSGLPLKAVYEAALLALGPEVRP